MDTKTYLNQLKNIDNRIKDLLKEAERWYDIATSTSGGDLTAPKVQTSPNPDRIGKVVGKVVDYQNACVKLAEEKAELKHQIIEQIKGLEGVDGEIHYNILYGFYVEKKNMNTIAVENGYSYRRIMSLFNTALFEFEKRYGETYLKI